MLAKNVSRSTIENNNAWACFHNDMKKSKSILKKYLFLAELVNKVAKKDQCNSKEYLNKKEGRCLKLPYVEFFSRYTHNNKKENH